MSSAAVSSSNSTHVASVVLVYWVVSISMVYSNKLLLSSPAASIPAPLFVTWYQCVLTCAICVALGHYGERTRASGHNSFLNEFSKVRYDVRVGLSVLPLTVIFVGMIAFNNLCLQYVEVSFYNVARSLSIVFNVIFTYLLLSKPTSLLTCGTLVVVIVGFVVGIDGEVNFSLVGTSSGVLSSLFVSLNGIYTSKVLPKVDNDKSTLLFYNNYNATFLFLPLIVLFETEVSVGAPGCRCALTSRPTNPSPVRRSSSLTCPSSSRPSFGSPCPSPARWYIGFFFSTNRPASCTTLCYRATSLTQTAHIPTGLRDRPGDGHASQSHQPAGPQHIRHGQGRLPWKKQNRNIAVG